MNHAWQFWVLHSSLLHAVFDNWGFLNTAISHGSVATHLRCGGIFNNLFTANLLSSLCQWKNFEYHLLFDEVIAMSLVPSVFFGIQRNIICRQPQASGDVPQTCYWGFGPGPHWGTPVLQTPNPHSQMLDPPYKWFGLWVHHFII